MSTPPLTVTKLIEGGRGLAPVLVKRAASVCLDWDVRQKSRFDATDSLGRRVGVFLPRGRCVRGGDVLVAEDGSMLRVDAARQPVLRVSPCPQHGSAFDLVRAAYHLGNRHVALELRPDHLKLEPDHVLAEMLTRMHLIVTPADEAFEPESGAYAAAGHEPHGHGGHHHGQDAAASHVHGPGDSHGKPHADPKHAHEHGHDHGHAEAHHGHVHGHAHAAAHDHDHGHHHGHGKPGHGNG